MRYYALLLFAAIGACGENPLESEVERLSEQVAYLSALIDEESSAKQDLTQHLWELDGTWVRFGFGSFHIGYELYMSSGVLVDTLHIAHKAEATYEYRLSRTVVEGEFNRSSSTRDRNDFVYQDDIADYLESYGTYYRSPKVLEERGEMIVRNGEAIIQWLERDDPYYDWQREQGYAEEIPAWDKRPIRAHIRWHRDYLVLNYWPWNDWPHEWRRVN